MTARLTDEQIAYVLNDNRPGSVLYRLAAEVRASRSSSGSGEREAANPHVMECNYRLGPIGAPGCICRVVNRALSSGERVMALEEALAALLRRDERNTCQHEETHRGGIIWTICDSCGAKWADDRGGKPDWKDPEEWTLVRRALSPQGGGGTER